LVWSKSKTPAGEVHALPDQAHDLALAHSGVDREGHDGVQVAVLRPFTHAEETHDLVFGEEPQPAFGLLGQTDLRNLLDVAPLLGEAKQVPKDRQLTVHGGGAQGPLPAGGLRHAVTVVLRDSLSGHVGDQRVLAEPAAHPSEPMLIVPERALSFGSLEVEVFLDDVTKRLGLRWGRRRIAAGETRRQRIEGVLPRPARVELALLLASHLTRVAVRDPLDLVARRAAAQPLALDDSAHSVVSAVDRRCGSAQG
jgi:hypothetical protein